MLEGISQSEHAWKVLLLPLACLKMSLFMSIEPIQVDSQSFRSSHEEWSLKPPLSSLENRECKPSGDQKGHLAFTYKSRSNEQT